MIISNIDKTDAQINTKAPFTYECTMKLGSIGIPSCAFLSIRIYTTPNTKLPVRLSRVYLINSSFVYVVFSGSDNKTVGTLRLPIKVSSSEYVSAFIRDAYGVIAGHVTCSIDLVDILQAAATLAAGSVDTAFDDFILLPQCYVPVPSNKCATVKLSVGSDYVSTHADVRLQPATPFQVTYSYPSESEPAEMTMDRIDWFKNQPSIQNDEIVLSSDGITNLSINGTIVPCAGKHLILKAAEKSNMRVSVSGDSIILSGVKDEH